MSRVSVTRGYETTGKGFRLPSVSAFPYMATYAPGFRLWNSRDPLPNSGDLEVGNVQANFINNYLLKKSTSNIYSEFNKGLNSRRYFFR